MKLPRISMRGGAAATLSVLLAATALAAMAPSQALDSTRVGPRDPSRAGFPAYYTDDSGVALQLCIDGTARCGKATLKSDGAGGPGVGVAPDGEGFYWLATSALSGPQLDIDIEFAAEAAWLNRRQPMTFDRLRIRGHSTMGCATLGDVTCDAVTVDTPYGQFTVPAGPPTDVRNVNFTEDVGCAVAPCNFRRMTTDRASHIDSWITNATHPAGYLGNSVRAQPSTVAGVGAATISVLGQDSTDRWVVMGKLAGPNRISLPNVLNFGNATRLATRSVTMRNLGTTARTLSAVTLKGSKTFTTMASSTCKSGFVLDVGKACSVGVKFKPGVRPTTATLTITDNVGSNQVSLKGR